MPPPPPSQIWNWIRRVKVAPDTGFHPTMKVEEHKNMKHVERRTLARIMPNLWAILWNLPK